MWNVLLICVNAYMFVYVMWRGGLCFRFPDVFYFSDFSIDGILQLFISSETVLPSLLSGFCGVYAQWSFQHFVNKF